MKKYIFLFCALLSFNVIGMEKSDGEHEVKKITSIESIPDELLLMILDFGIMDCLIPPADLGEDLGTVFNKLVDFFGTMELVNKHFNKCGYLLVKRLGELEFNKEFKKDEPFVSFEKVVPADRILAMSKLFAVNACIKKHIQLIDQQRKMTGMALCKVFSSDSMDQHFKLFHGRSVDYIGMETWNTIIKLIIKGFNIDSLFKHYAISSDGREKIRASLLCLAILLKNHLMNLKSILKNNIIDCKDIIRFLLFYRANLNLADTKGRTPLMLALKNGDWALAKFLINHDANPKICDKNGETPLMYALKSYSDCFIRLLESGLLDILLKRGMDINAKDVKDRNAMYWAFNKPCAVINWLADNGVRLNELFDIEIFGPRRRSILAWAVHAGKTQLVQSLLEKNADIYCQDTKGETVIECARKRVKKYPSDEKGHSILKMIEAKEKENLEMENTADEKIGHLDQATNTQSQQVPLPVIIDNEKENLELGGSSFCTLF